MDLTLHPLTTTPTLLPKSARSCSIWISTMDISTHLDQPEQTTNRLHLRINEPDQDAPWRLTPWAHAVIIVDSLATLPASVWNQSKRKELALNVERKTICLRIAQFAATKKPGQKCLFGYSMHQENMGTNNSPAEESNEGDADKEIEDETKEDSHLAKETSECHTHLFHQRGLSDFKF